MSVSERERHRLYDRAIEILGEEEATILMAHLPPGGYPNLATKQDLLMLRQELGRELGGLESRLRGFVWRTIVMANLAMAATFAGIAFGAANLA